MNIIIPNLSAILAVDKNGGIGINNKLPWHYPEDLQWFRQQTNNKTIIMGSNTFTSILQYNKGKPLANRHHIVLTTKQDFKFNNVEICRNTQNLIERISRNDQEYLLIGGASLYNLFLPVVNKLYLTTINNTYDCDSFVDLKKYFNQPHQLLLSQNSQNSQNNLIFEIFKKV